MRTERRAHPRAELRRPATVFSARGRETVQTVDVSEAGLAYISRRADAVGSFLRVNLRVFDDPNSWIDVDGVVRRLDRRDGTYTHGVQFVGISEPAAIRLRHYVAIARPEPEPEPAKPVTARPATPKPATATPVAKKPRVRQDPSLADTADELGELFRKALEQVE